jgi:ABC-type transport system involved in cytochrome c biogenesis ATPase subunit
MNKLSESSSNTKKNKRNSFFYSHLNGRKNFSSSLNNLKVINEMKDSNKEQTNIVAYSNGNVSYVSRKWLNSQLNDINSTNDYYNPSREI